MANQFWNVGLISLLKVVLTQQFNLRLQIQSQATLNEKQQFTQKEMIQGLITYMKKLLDSDWLRAVQLKSNTSAKSVIPVQKT